MGVLLILNGLAYVTLLLGVALVLPSLPLLPILLVLRRLIVRLLLLILLLLLVRLPISAGLAFSSCKERVLGGAAGHFAVDLVGGAIGCAGRGPGSVAGALGFLCNNVQASRSRPIAPQSSRKSHKIPGSPKNASIPGQFSPHQVGGGDITTINLRIRDRISAHRTVVSGGSCHCLC
jgi:hypothetical protein